MRKHILFFSITSFVLVFFSSCFDLDEIVYHDEVPDTFIQGEEQLKSVVTSTYSWFRFAATARKAYSAQELPADQIVGVAKQNGSGSYDNGRQVDLHWHTYTPENECIEEAWDVWIQLLAGANMNLDIIKNVNYKHIGLDDDLKTRNIAETIILRDIALFYLMDLFGNVPAPTVYDANELPVQKTPAEIFKIIDEDINTVCADLPLGGTSASYGRVTQGVAKTLQAVMYLNAENYGVEPKWRETKEICKDIISGKYGKYELGKTFYEAFDWNNKTSKEIILSAPMNEVFTGRPEIFYTWNHRGSRDFWGLNYRGNNQLGVSPSYNPEGELYQFSHKLGTPIANYDPKDLRISKPAHPDEENGGGMFQYGELKSSLGKAKGEKEYKGETIVLVDQVARFKSEKPASELESTVMHGEENSCYRWSRYRIYPVSESEKYFQYDYVVFRYADIYYMLAESMLRLGEPGYAKYVNEVKQRNFLPGDFTPYTDATLDLDELLCDRGREFIGEGTRRRDLIRYGYFNLPWWDKPQTEEYKKIFPIPQRALSANPNLKQNPGYEDHIKE